MNHNAHKDHNDIVHTITPLDEATNKVAEQVLDCAFNVHRKFGPGLLESAYGHVLCHDLAKKHGLKVESQKLLPIVHDGLHIEAGYRIDLLVNNAVIVELKCVEKILPIHEAQLITYLKLSNLRLGLVLNFKSRMLKDGIKRIVV